MIRKVLVVGLLVASVANFALADVYVSWRATAGFYFSATPGVGILGDGTGNSTLAQLIWSPDNIADAAMAGAANYVSGNDVWLADLTITEDGIANDATMYDSYAYFSSVVTTDGGANPIGGYVYARIFESSTISAGDWYYVGNVVLAADLNSADPLVTPQGYEMNRDTANGDAIDGIYGAQVVPVPEPGTMALFALGVATLAASRRRRKVQA